MREEHTMLPDSNDEFSTPNYGLTTTPSKEWALVLEGGSGCAKVEGKEDSVSVTGTRGCCKKGQTQPDVRVLRPITYYGDFGVDGRLRWGVGDEVVVGEAFTIVGNRKELAKDTEGTVLEFNAEGAAKIAFRKIPHALMLVLSCLDDAGLRREFDAHVDLEDKGERRMSKAGLAKFMSAKGLAHGEAEVERVMKRVDTNGDFEIDFLEFCGLARANSDLELVLRSQKLECILAAFFPSPNYGLTTAHSVKGVGARARGRQQVCRGGGERAQRLRDGHAGLLQKRPDAVGRARAAPDRLLRLLCRRRPPQMGRGR
jgi:hypothetical protein